MYQWSLLTQANRPSVLKKLGKDLSVAVPGHGICVLTLDQQSGSYHGPCNGQQFGSLIVNSLRDTDPALRDLLAGKTRAFREDVPDMSMASGGSGRRTALFPITVQGQIDHVLAVSADSLSNGEMRLIEGYCRQTGLAIETLEIQRNLNHKIERLSSLVGMLDDLAADQSYRNLPQTVLDRSAELLLAEQGSILLLEKETGVLLLEASKGEFDEPTQPVRVLKGVGIAGKVAEMGEPILVEDIERDPRVGKKSRARYKTVSFVSVPLKIGNRIVGVMNFADKISGKFFDDVDLHLARTCASHAAIVLDRKNMCEEAERLKQEATTDTLTGLLNRGYMLNRLREELARSERFAKVMSLMMLDLDGFKNINDALGHGTGDRVLKMISQAMAGAVRSIDIIGRYGGDEFMIILPETDAFFAVNIAERVRSDIARVDIARETMGRITEKMTTSIGIATFPSHGTSPEVLVDHADEALYRAKKGGRDRVVVY